MSFTRIEVIMVGPELWGVHTFVNSIYLKNKLASSKLRYSETITHSLTGVKCRATSVAKNISSKLQSLTSFLLGVAWFSLDVP